MHKPLPDEELLEFANALYQILTRTKSHQVLCKVFQCLSALLMTIDNDKNQAGTVFVITGTGFVKSQFVFLSDFKLQEIWSKILEATIRQAVSTLSSKVFQVFESCCEFLSNLIVINVTSTSLLFPKIWKSALDPVPFSQ